MSWHWESYVAKNNLWYHFGRFKQVIQGINPIEEHFVTSLFETDSLRIYVLKGRNTTLAWIREKNSNWQTELDKKIAARTLYNLKLDAALLGIKKRNRINVYDPWQNKWNQLNGTTYALTLPDFKRSLILRFKSR